MFRIICILCATAVAGSAATNGPAVCFTFDDDPCADSSRNGFAATASGVDFNPGEAGVDIEWFLPACAVARAGRPVTLIARIANPHDAKRDCTAAVFLPSSVAVAGASLIAIPALPARGAANLSWTVQSESAQEVEAILVVRGGGLSEITRSCTIRFTEPVRVQKAAYVPEPNPAKSDVLIGSLNCP
ncbi:MAG TPA: hypothetical protein PLY86_20385, partial [bacterium]|nr:hypothetical protein [bacterium]